MHHINFTDAPINTGDEVVILQSVGLIDAGQVFTVQGVTPEGLEVYSYAAENYRTYPASMFRKVSEIAPCTPLWMKELCLKHLITTGKHLGMVA